MNRIIFAAGPAFAAPPPAAPAPVTPIEHVTHILERPMLGNSLWQWLVAIAVGILAVIALSLIRAVALRRFRQAAQHSHATGLALAVELIAGTGHWFFAVIGLYLAASGVSLQPAVDKIIRFVVVGGVALQIGGWANSVIIFLIHRYLQRRGKERGETDGAVETTMVAVRFISLILVYSLVAIIAADNLGFNVTALITGLGVGGIAVALAVQNILGDLFSALSIVLDKPFVVGDFIVVGPQMGTVEHIGLKSTRVRALSGELLVFRNTDLLASRIQNFKRMQERRVEFKVGVTYSTPPNLVARLPAIIREVIVSQPNVRFDRAHFARLADSALELEAVYYVLSPEYNNYMDIQQNINLELLGRFRDLGVEFAFPSQTLYFAGGNTGPTPPLGPMPPRG